MKKVEREKLENLVHELAQAYFVERDYKKIIKYISPGVSWFGTGANEVCRSLLDAVRYIGQEQEIYQGSFRLSNEWYHITTAREDMACVMAEMDVEADPASGYLLKLHLRFSVVLLRESGRWKIWHLHNSVPYHDQGDASFFDQETARAEHTYMENMARELAAEHVEAVRSVDTLTGVLNMEGFVRRARELMEQYPHVQYAVIRLKLNHLDYINQSCGYAVGDEVLKGAAEYLRDGCTTREACGRAEHDGFLLLLEFFTQAELDEHLRALDAHIRGKVRQPVSFTAGIYLPRYGESEEPKSMLDKAMTAQKGTVYKKTGSSWSYFDPQSYALRRYNAWLLEHAPGAMERGDFKLFIQPQVDLKTMRAYSGEALARWVQRDGSVIMPDEFISLFEQSGQIVDFDFYMLELVCAQIRRWMDQGYAIGPVSVNQSRLHADDPDYVRRFCETVDRYGVPHSALSYELTESAFTKDRKAMIELAKSLHERGFQIELDDFGSGYASLDLITDLCADVLKIDRSLLAGLGGRKNERGSKVLQKVIELAHETGMTVVCEGVETRRQLDLLKRMGCDVVQGFYFYQPMPTEEFERTVLSTEQSACIGQA